MLIDFHTHSNISDGSLSQIELVDKAISEKIKVLALCDHDTTNGNKTFLKYAVGKDIKAIPGIELSASWSNGNCHILGLSVRDDYKPLEDALKEIRNSRKNRNIVIINKLNDLGINITFNEVESLAGGDVVGRPHIARVLVNKGMSSSVKDAFGKYLAKGCFAYSERYHLEPVRAVKLLNGAGAKVILAHPSQLNCSIEVLSCLIEKLKPNGLWGIEVYTPYATDELAGFYCDLANKHALMITGGSDFHGVSKPDHFLGYWSIGNKNKKIPTSVCLDF